MRWGPRGRVIGVAIAIESLLLLSLAGVVPFVPSVSNNATAMTSATVYLNTTDYGYGSIERWDTVYPPTANEFVNTGGTYNLIAHAYNSFVGVYTTDRTFLGFNTSSIPANVEVISAKLFVQTTTTVVPGSWACEVYQSDFGTLDLTDWDVFTNFQGTLFNGTGVAANTWYSISLNPTSIRAGGESQFFLKVDGDPTATPTTTRGCGFFTNKAGSYPYIELTYGLKQVNYYMELSTGAWVNATVFPEIQPWNLTSDLYTFEIDTVPNAYNLTIEKEADWLLGDFSPFGNYTLDATWLLMNDVWDSITYRIWFLVPNGQPSCFVHLSVFNAFTGEGIAFEAIHMSYCTGVSWNDSTAQDITSPDIYLFPYQNYTLRMEDFFGNVLVDYVYLPNAAVNYLAIPIPIYSWQIFNMNDAPVLMRIYWNNSGSPWEFFVGPHWIIERFLKGGGYSFMVTFYDTTGVAGETVYYNRTVPMTGLNASFVYVNGTTLSEVVSSVEGVMAVQQIITSLVSPSVVVIYEDLPLAPVKLRMLSLSTRIAVDPYLILEATTYQNQTGTALADTALWLPHPDSLGCTYYIIADTLTFSGTYLTEIYVNDTDGNNLYTGTVLPAALVLGGQNLTVWANNSFSVSRATTWREISEYTVNYYSTQRKYEATVSLNNSCSFDYHSPYWYISFPQNTTIDQDTVTLYDLDNSVYLSQRTNFDVTAGGIHLTLTQLNSSNARNFRLTYWDKNGTVGIGAPNLIAEAYTQGSLNGVSMKYTAVQWTNPWSVEYRGEVYISLNFTDGDNLLRSSITIIDETTGNAIPSSQWVYTGRTIFILTDGVGTVPVGGARNYGIYFTFDVEKAPTKTDFFFGPIVWNGQQFWIAGWAVSWALILILVGWCGVVWRYWNDEKHHDAFMFFVIWGSVSVILMYFSSVMG
jgi:hypothetical protein